MFALTAAKKLVYRISSTDTLSALQKAQVPLSDAPCRDCPDPCDREDAHEGYPAKLKIDHERQLLGTVKAYHKQVRGLLSLTSRLFKIMISASSQPESKTGQKTSPALMGH